MRPRRPGSGKGAPRLAAVRVLDSPDPWFGMTYREDRDTVAARLRELVARGDYPPRLWASTNGDPK